MQLAPIIAEIERRAEGRAIGRLQEVRKDLKKLARLATNSIFSSQTIFEDQGYAYHHGGRSEMQFNVGTDRPGMFRHGVAFSFEPSRSLPNPEEALLTSVRRFNEVIELYSNMYSDMSMWEWDRGDRRYSDRALVPIRADLIRRGMFLFIGKLQPLATLDCNLIVEDLDRLVPLYEFVEGHEEFPRMEPTNESDEFRPGCRLKRRFTTASLAQRVLDVDLRHNEMQKILFDALEREHGTDRVATEWASKAGRVDVVLRNLDGALWFYEIKTGLSARACIREGLGQILEYAYWPGTQEPEKVFIVGEPELDTEAEQYIALLNTRFSLGIEYRQCIVPDV